MRQFSPIKTRWPVFIQVAALLFLQVYAVLPVFGQMTAPPRHGTVCSGDHRLCGCPVEKIVNRTCCCFRSADRAADRLDHPTMHSARTPATDTDHLPRLVCPPCGSDPDFTFATREEIKFLRFMPVLEGSDSLAAFIFSLSGGSFRTRAIEPPDPPPKFGTL